jgi:hypothetical protein
VISLTGIGFTVLTAVLAPCEVRCPCAVPPAPWNTAAYLVPRALNQADAVFAGRVIRADTLVRDTLFVARDRAATRPRVIRYTFRVSRSWKGEPGDKVRVTDRNVWTTCDHEFEVGAKYLVYLDRDMLTNQPGEYATHGCDRAPRLHLAVADLRILGPGRSHR